MSKDSGISSESGDITNNVPSLPKTSGQSAQQRLSRRTLFWLVGLAGGALATGGVGRLIYVLNYQHARYIYRGHATIIRALAWSPTSQRVASGADNLQVWDALSGEHVQTFPAPEGVQAVAWSPDGKYLASGNGDGTATVWETASSKQPIIYRGHLPVPFGTSRGVDDLAWSPDGTRLLSTGPDETTQVWEAMTGRTLFTLGRRAAYVEFAVWSPDGRQIAGLTTTSGGGVGVGFWDAISGAPLSAFWMNAPAVSKLVWSPNGRYLAAATEQYNGSDQGVSVWEVATGRNIILYQGHMDTIFVTAWSPDSRRIASAGQDMTVRVWDVTTGQTEYIYRGHQGFWQQYFSAQVPGVPARASVNPLANSRTRGGVLTTSAPFLLPQDTHDPLPEIRALVWSPDGQFIASGGFDQDMTATVQVWQPGQE